MGGLHTAGRYRGSRLSLAGGTTLSFAKYVRAARKV